MGVDDDELRARVLGVGDVLPHLDLGIDGVGAHEQDVVGIHEILGFALIEPLDAATREAGVRRRVERVLPFAAAAGRAVDAAHRILDARIRIGALDARAALQARAVVEVRLRQHVAHVAVSREYAVLAERTGPRAGAVELLAQIGRIGGNVLVHLKIARARRLAGRECACGCGACRHGGGSFDEVAARQRLSHISLLL